LPPRRGIVVAYSGRKPAEHNEFRRWFASWPWDATMMKTMMDRAQLADFLRKRRDALRPADVGLTGGPHRRTEGLRREEVAALCGMSVDYLARLEQQRGPQPSDQMLAAIARGLRLTQDERDHLFQLAGRNAPQRALRADHVNPGIMRVLDRLYDTPAQVVTGLGEALVQNQTATALLGNTSQFTGKQRSLIYRWFTDVDARRIYPREDHEMHSRAFASDLRTMVSREGNASRAAAMVRELVDVSSEFERVWEAHEVGLVRSDLKRIVHPELGVLQLHCQMLFDFDQSQALLVFTATPGSESYERLQLLSVIGEQRLSP
jgi:transcriptional regulator with XRE-family HTH domain